LPGFCTCLLFFGAGNVGVAPSFRHWLGGYNRCAASALVARNTPDKRWN
jgi:hypothetical protein